MVEEMTIRPMTAEERMYSYTQSQQISMQTGLIGYLRADMDSNGKGFFSSWNGFRDSLKTEDFKLEFDEVLNELREEGNLLHDRRTLSRHCYQTPVSSFQNDRNEYGFRADTDHYSYLMRVNPNKGEYNLYCYCYVRQWLERHMRQAEKGIRFITPAYKEIFRIPDGDRIRMTLPFGDTLEQTCRYIDDTHLEVGNVLYHICEFAERMQQNGIKTIPLRSSLPEKCFSSLESTGEMIVITKGQQGYSPTGIFPQDVSPGEGVTAANAANGVTKAQEAAMVAGSMFGWETPAADPRNYDENGVPVKNHNREKDAR